jgi:uncharacterized membrane protein
MKNEGEYEVMSDAPPHVLRGRAKASLDSDETFVGRTVTIGRPRQENVAEVQDLGGNRSHWMIKAPGGGEVELVTRIIEDMPGERIAWESEKGSGIDASGVLTLTDAPPGRGTYVRLLMSYDPPGAAIGRGIAKLLQREPSLQARRDLRRFKQLMETGEVTKNASPSARRSENPIEARI